MPSAAYHGEAPVTLERILAMEAEARAAYLALAAELPVAPKKPAASVKARIVSRRKRCCVSVVVELAKPEPSRSSQPTKRRFVGLSHSAADASRCDSTVGVK